MTPGVWLFFLNLAKPPVNRMHLGTLNSPALVLVAVSTMWQLVCLCLMADYDSAQR